MASMDDHDAVRVGIPTTYEAWDRIHDSLRAAGIDYAEASEGVEKLRKQHESVRQRAEEKFQRILQYAQLLDAIHRVLKDAGAQRPYGAGYDDLVRGVVQQRDQLRTEREHLWSSIQEQLRAAGVQQGNLIEGVKELRHKCENTDQALRMAQCNRAQMRQARDDAIAERDALNEKLNGVCEVVSELSPFGSMVDAAEGVRQIARLKDDYRRQADNAHRALEEMRNARDELDRELGTVPDESTIHRLNEELKEAREEAAAEGMARRDLENTLAEVRASVERHDGKVEDAEADGQANPFQAVDDADQYVDWDQVRSTLLNQSRFPTWGIKSDLQVGDRVKVVSHELGAGHRGEVGVVHNFNDDAYYHTVKVRFDRDYKLDELERV